MLGGKLWSIWRKKSGVNVIALGLLVELLHSAYLHWKCPYEYKLPMPLQTIKVKSTAPACGVLFFLLVIERNVCKE